MFCLKCGEKCEPFSTGFGEEIWKCPACGWDSDEPINDPLEPAVEPQGIELPQSVSDWLQAPSLCLSCGRVEMMLKAAALITRDGVWCECGGDLTTYNDFQKEIEPLWRDLGGSE